jgi:hypothetical protein
VDPNPIIEFFPALASRQVYIFDPDGEDGTPLIGKWDEKAKMPATRTFATHAAVIENSFGIPLDPKSNVQVGRVTHHTVVLHDGKVLLIGGRWSQPTLYFGIPQVDLYDPETDEWTRLADMPAVPDDADAGYGGRGFPGVSLLGSGEVLIFGGLANRLVGVGKGGEFRFHAEGPSVPRSSAIILNPMTNQWRRVGNMNVGRSGLLAAPWPSVDTATFAIAIGGLLPHTSKKIPPAEVYDSSTETWFLLPSEPEAETDDSQIRQGTGLDDGTVLTWSSDPSLGPYGNTSVKRLHPAGLDE